MIQFAKKATQHRAPKPVSSTRCMVSRPQICRSSKIFSNHQSTQPISRPLCAQRSMRPQIMPQQRKLSTPSRIHHLHTLVAPLKPRRLSTTRKFVSLNENHNNNNNHHGQRTLSIIKTQSLPYTSTKAFTAAIIKNFDVAKPLSRRFSKFATEPQAPPASDVQLEENAVVTNEEFKKKPADTEWAPPSETTTYPQKVIDLVNQTTQLNMLEQMLFLKCFAEKIGIPFDLAKDLAKGNVGAAPASQQAAPVQEEKKEAPKKQKLVMVGMAEGAKYKVLKELKTLIPGKSIGDYKAYVEKFPQTLLADTTKDEAEKWISPLKAAGAIVELQKGD